MVWCEAEAEARQRGDLPRQGRGYRTRSAAFIIHDALVANEQSHMGLPNQVIHAMSYPWMRSLRVSERNCESEHEREIQENGYHAESSKSLQAIS